MRKFLIVISILLISQFCSNIYAKKMKINGFYEFHNKLTKAKNLIQITRVSKSNYYIQLFYPGSLINFRSFYKLKKRDFIQLTKCELSYGLKIKKTGIYFYFKNNPNDLMLLKEANKNEVIKFIDNIVAFQLNGLQQINLISTQLKKINSR